MIYNCNASQYQRFDENRKIEFIVKQLTLIFKLLNG